jgi:hypothetical protein
MSSSLVKRVSGDGRGQVSGACVPAADRQHRLIVNDSRWHSAALIAWGLIGPPLLP